VRARVHVLKRTGQVDLSGRDGRLVAENAAPGAELTDA